MLDRGSDPDLEVSWSFSTSTRILFLDHLERRLRSSWIFFFSSAENFSLLLRLELLIVLSLLSLEPVEMLLPHVLLLRLYCRLHQVGLPKVVSVVLRRDALLMMHVRHPLISVRQLQLLSKLRTWLVPLLAICQVTAIRRLLSARWGWLTYLGAWRWSPERN